MKKTKIMQVFILVFSMSLLTTGCSNEKVENENSRTDLSFEESLKMEKEGVLTIDDKTYVIFENKKNRKFDNYNFSYDIVSDLKYDIVSDLETETKDNYKTTDDSIVIQNSLNNSETLTFFNIEAIDEYQLRFSVIASNGVEITNLMYESETSLISQDESSKVCWKCWAIVIETVGGAIIDGIIDGIGSGGMDMTQVCLAQIKACVSTGGTPTNIQASSSWYGGSSCSLDCIPN
ncbi:MAG: hypothetical protein ACPG41_02260 [Lacinutrix venerupis]